MNKLETIKDKMAKKANKPLEIQTQEFIQAVQQEVAVRLTESEQAKVVQDIGKIIEEVKRIFSSQENTFDEVIGYLNAKSKEAKRDTEVTNRFYSNVIDGLTKLAKQKPLKGLTKKEVQDAFIGALDTVQNILVKNNEVPGAVSVKYNSSGKVSQITQNYDGYTLVTNIRYNSEGMVSSWTTNRA